MYYIVVLNLSFRSKWLPFRNEKELRDGFWEIVAEISYFRQSQSLQARG